MSQIKIYGLRDTLASIRAELSDVVHSCVVDALAYPKDKRAHRFFLLDKEDFYYPEGRSERYIIIEISMIVGRSVEAKKKLINLLFERIEKSLSITPTDVEITITETPAHNWGFRGRPGDEHVLNYKIEV